MLPAQGKALRVVLLALAGVLPALAGESQEAVPKGTVSPSPSGPDPAVVAKAQPLRVPRLDAPPRIEDFLSMEPSPAWAGKMLKIDRFYQREPKDGAPV